MLLIARGKTRMEIARKLNLSPETISAYRKRILQKLRLSTSVEISRYAFENHLIE
jgi:DNA-binding CsgD family transcriptional regulator